MGLLDDIKSAIKGDEAYQNRKRNQLGPDQVSKEEAYLNRKNQVMAEMYEENLTPEQGVGLPTQGPSQGDILQYVEGSDAPASMNLNKLVGELELRSGEMVGDKPFYSTPEGQSWLDDIIYMSEAMFPTTSRAIKLALKYKDKFAKSSFIERFKDAAHYGPHDKKSSENLKEDFKNAARYGKPKE